MGTFNTNVIQSSGDDRSFLTLVYNFIMGLDSGITASVTPTNFPYASKTVSNMDFTLDTNVVFRLQSYPGDNLSRPTSSGYNFAFIVNGNTIMSKGIGSYTTSGNPNLPFVDSFTYVSDSKVRKYMVSSYDSENVKIFWIGPYNSTDFTTSGGISVIKFKDANDVWYWGAYAGANIESCTITDSTGATSSSKSSMFTYAALAGYIDYIRESSYVSGGVKVFSSADIYDCSTVTLGSTITLNDGNYMAIGAHSLVKL